MSRDFFVSASVDLDSVLVVETIVRLTRVPAIIPGPFGSINPGPGPRIYARTPNPDTQPFGCVRDKGSNIVILCLAIDGDKFCPKVVTMAIGLFPVGIIPEFKMVAFSLPEIESIFATLMNENMQSMYNK